MANSSIAVVIITVNEESVTIIKRKARDSVFQFHAQPAGSGDNYPGPQSSDAR